MSVFCGEKDAVIVDCGVSTKYVENGLSVSGVDINRVAGIIVTHTHTDHVSGLSPLIKKYKIPVFTDEIIKKELITTYKIDPRLVRESNLEKGLKIGEFLVEGFRVSHDAQITYGYNISLDREKTSIITDAGFISDANLRAIEDCDNLILESNYNEDLLYANYKLPLYIKNRIASDCGHMSNENSAKILNKILKNNKLKKFAVAHKSEENNSSDLIIDAIISALKINNIKDIGLNKMSIFLAKKVMSL